MSAAGAFPVRVGGRLCLDFVNTVDPRRPGERRDYLSDYFDVLDWYGGGDVPLPQPIESLRRRANLDPALADAAYDEVVAMRESLLAVFNASRAAAPVRTVDLVTLNQALGESAGHRFLVPDERGGVGEEWRSAAHLTQVLWPVAIDAWDLLTEPELAQVRQCPLEVGGCGWLFLDLSRAGNRRWCDMRTCGNRAKVRAHYSRTAGN